MRDLRLPLRVSKNIYLSRFFSVLRSVIWSAYIIGDWEIGKNVCMLKPRKKKQGV